MLKEFSWKAFEVTGNIEAYMFFKEIEDKNFMVRERKAAEEEVATSN